MHRRAVALLLATVGAGAATGCAEKDNRPLELEYLTEAIFAPACGATQCHSTFRQAEGLVFDTVAGTRRALHSTDTGIPWLSFDYDHPDPAFPYESRLYTIISQTVPFPPSDTPRMPLDAPLPGKDIELLRLWIKAPSTEPRGDGGYALGAQCDPDLNPHRYACDRDRVVTCDDDWNFGDTLTFCPNGCTRDFPTVCHDPTCTSTKRSECEVPCDPENPEDMCRE